MGSQEINETIGKLEGLFDKLIQLKILENESRRLKIQESQGGNNFPSDGLIESKLNHVTREEWVGVRRNQIHEALTGMLDSGRETYVLSSSELKAIQEAKKRNQLIFQGIIQERSCVSMFEFMGRVSNANGEIFGKDGEVLFDEAKKISEEFKNNWKCHE